MDDFSQNKKSENQKIKPRKRGNFCIKPFSCGLLAKTSKSLEGQSSIATRLDKIQSIVYLFFAGVQKKINKDKQARFKWL